MVVKTAQIITNARPREGGEVYTPAQHQITPDSPQVSVDLIAYLPQT